MQMVGHYRDGEGRSCFRVFAPEKACVAVVLEEGGTRWALESTPEGYWETRLAQLAAGTLYWLEVDGRRLPDPASRYQPQGVHGPSMVVDIEPARTPGWGGVHIGEAILYELHVGTFTPEGTLAAARARLPWLRDLGINVVELLPLAACPGERNWGYDGVALFALHAPYGSWADLRAFIEAAHDHGIAVVLDVVYNHLGPEGNYTGAFAPYTRSGDTPWGAAMNFDGPYNHGVREFFLANTWHWLHEVGFDGFRMDAVQFIFDQMPLHILRAITDLAREIGRAQGREVLMIAEHLRNNLHVTSGQGLGYHAQWNDDVNHALFAHLTGETGRHYVNFGSFEDVLKALQAGFVLDGTRFDRYSRFFLGSDASGTEGTEHVVHIQNHDQVGNRPRGDRMIATYGTPRALLAITAVMASPFVPMLFQGEEYGETAPFYFFEDFGDPALVEAVRVGRRGEFGSGGVEMPDPHDRATFLASKLRWDHAATPEGQRVLAWYRLLIGLKRTGDLGPRQRAQVRVEGDAATRVIQVHAPGTRVVLNFSDATQWLPDCPGAWIIGRTGTGGEAASLEPYEAVVWRLRDA